jgi:hypothetical protein
MQGLDIAQMVFGNSRLHTLTLDGLSDHGKLASVFDTPHLPLHSLHVNSLQRNDLFLGFVSTSTSLFEVSVDQVVLDKTLTSAKLRRAWRENRSLQRTVIWEIRKNGRLMKPSQVDKIMAQVNTSNARNAATTDCTAKVFESFRQ